MTDSWGAAAARLWAADRFPYLASALFALDVRPVVDLGGIQIDEWWRVGFDPVVARSWSADQLGAELVHLTTHVLRDHAGRARELARGAGLADSAELAHWVDSVDAEIADDLPSDLPRVRPQIRADDLAAMDGQLAETYWRQGLPRRGALGAPVELSPICDCGSGAHGAPSWWEPPPPKEGGGGVEREQQQLLRQQVAQDIRAAGVEAPAGLRRWAEGFGRRHVDWRRVLAADLQRAIMVSRGAVDYSYRRPSRRSGTSPGVVLPSLRSPETRVAVVVDTSASVDDEALGLAMSEIDAILATSGVTEVRVLSCDAAVHASHLVRTARDVELFGGGGTDLRVGLAAAADDSRAPAVVVVITDGHTPWPDEQPRGRGRPPETIVALLPDSLPRPTPPAWARIIEIETTERETS